MAQFRVDDELVKDVGEQYRDETGFEGTDRQAFIEWLKMTLMVYRDKKVQQGINTDAVEAADEAVNTAQVIALDERAAVDSTRRQMVANMRDKVIAGVS